MTETLGTQELETELVLQAKPQIFKWLRNIWLQPRATLQNILSFEKGVWLVPLLLLSGLQIIKNLIEGPIRSAAVMQALQEKAVKQAMEAMSMGGGGGGSVDATQPVTAGFTAGPIYNILLPALLGVIAIWVVWVIFGSMLHLSLTLAGNRSNASTSLNLMAWASLPLVVRFIVQTGGILVSQKLIASPGLSGFISTQDGTLASFISSFVANVDIYLIWQIVLLVVGAMVMGNISRSKAILSVVICALVMLAFQAIPGTVMQSLSGMSSSSFFFF